MTFNFVAAAWMLVVPFGIMSLAYFIKQFKGGIHTVEVWILILSLFIVAGCIGILA